MESQTDGTNYLSIDLIATFMTHQLPIVITMLRLVAICADKLVFNGEVSSLDLVLAFFAFLHMLFLVTLGADHFVLVVVQLVVRAFDVLVAICALHFVIRTKYNRNRSILF